jgi:hypothetical protein
VKKHRSVSPPTTNTSSSSLFKPHSPAHSDADDTTSVNYRSTGTAKASTTPTKNDHTWHGDLLDDTTPAIASNNTPSTPTPINSTTFDDTFLSFRSPTKLTGTPKKVVSLKDFLKVKSGTQNK